MGPSKNHMGWSGAQGRSMTVGQSSLVINKSTISTTIGGQEPTRQIRGSPSPMNTKESCNPDRIRDLRRFDPVQMNVWFHELRTSSEDVIVNIGLLPGIREGDIAELEPLEGSSRKLYFVVKDPAEERKKANFQISLMSGSLQTLMDLPSRSTALVRLKKKEEVQADLIEIYIKDIHLTRDDMWKFAAGLVGTCVYRKKRVSFLDSIRGSVDQIYRNGKKAFSAYIGEDTKVVFRSESARLYFLIQISREMWHFEESGEIMFHKLINALFPQIFQKWLEIGTHHLLTIVLFTSVDLTNVPWSKLQQGERPSQRRDFFRVVVDQVNIAHWDKIMAALRLEFKNFMQEIIVREKDGKSVIEGGLLPSIKGNILEAINVVTTLIMDRFRDTDLKHTTNHFIVITPGTGLFDVDYDLMLNTSRKILSLDVALDIICLSQPPLHVVPLLRYINNNGKLAHCIPSWCDISFWNDSTQISNQWIPRCKIYELQMMGVMETEMNDVSIENLESFRNSKTVSEAMMNYDEDIFQPFDQESTEKENFNYDNARAYSDERNLKSKSSSLSLILNFRPNNPTKVDPSTTTSPIFGTVTNSRSDVSALSALYTLTKSDDHSIKVLDSESSSFQKTETDSISTIKAIDTPRVLSSKDRMKKSRKQPKEIGSQRTGQSNRIRAERKRSSNANLESEGPSNQLWTEVENPSKEAKAIILGFLNYSKWTDVFPEKVRRRQVKWRSLASPASLPTTTAVFPTPHELQTEYTFQSYDVSINWDSQLKLSASDLLREMISLRLLLGFQICVGPKVSKVESRRKPDGNADALIKYLPKDSNGSRMYLSLDNEIHRISCDYHGNLNVQLYHQTEATAGPSLEGYYPNIRTRYDEDYTPAKIDALNEKTKKYNWNQLDQLVAGYDDAMAESKKTFHRMKFVILPADIPNSAYHQSSENETLSAEEIRLDGITKLISNIYRGRFHATKEENVGSRKKEEILSDISFYTGNLYDFLSHEAEKYIAGAEQKDSLFVPESLFQKNVKLLVLAQEMQGQKGITFVDRTWHFKTHPHCFVSAEYVSWLIENFEDVDTREAAVAFGQSLMNKGLFKHVENRHGFLDGHYFYELANEYIDRTAVIKDKDSGNSGWFSRKSVSSTNNSPNPKKSTSISSSQTNNKVDSDNDSVTTKASATMLSQNTQDSSVRRILSQNFVSQGNTHYTTSVHPQDDASFSTSMNEGKKKVVLSRSLKYDLDPFKKSFRPELVTVHYDRVHNPEHCFHIRLEWLNTTSKLIDDTITNWARFCERYGLRLVETPWIELCTIPTRNPFHSFVDLKLSINPWSDPEFCADIGKKILKENIFYYHMYFLQISGFLLDNRATIFFQKEDVDIEYSWGKPKFKYAQYIHKTGAYIAEIRDNGEFFLAPNNTHVTRVNNSATANDQTGDFFLDSQKVMLKFRADCNNEDKLREIFAEAKEAWNKSSGCCKKNGDDKNQLD